MQAALLKMPSSGPNEPHLRQVQALLASYMSNVAGAALKEKSLGLIGNSLAGVVGGGLGGTILHAVMGAATSGGGGMDMTSIIGNVAGGGVGGAVLMAVIGMIKDAMAKK